MGKRIELKRHVENIVHHPVEYDYAHSLMHIINASDYVQKDRTNTGCIVGEPTTFICSADILPKLVGKAVVPNLAFKEMLWFMLGKTDKESLNALGVNYWNPWFNEAGNIGKSYGYQFRKHPDQLQKAVRTLSTDPTSRRNIINLWNNEDLDNMVLPPCFYNYQFITRIGENGLTYVDMIVTSRSCDAFIGLPYNFLSAWFLYHTVLAYVDNNHYFGNIVFNIANYHLYTNHIDQAIEYINNLNHLAKEGIKPVAPWETIRLLLGDLRYEAMDLNHFLDMIHKEFLNPNSELNKSVILGTSKFFLDKEELYYKPPVIKAPIAV